MANKGLVLQHNVGVNIFNRHLQMADKGWFSSIM